MIGIAYKTDYMKLLKHLLKLIIYRFKGREDKYKCQRNKFIYYIKNKMTKKNRK